jgi:GT2 family glycosyltransferase
MELSIIIVTYRCKALVLDCLRSLERQRSSVEMEALVVDNDSDDGTLAAIAEEFPWVGAASAGGNLGFAKANNLALRTAGGEYVLLLNPDTVVPDGALRRCIDELERRPDVGLLGCKLVQPNGELDHACKRGFPTLASSLAYFAGLHHLFPGNPRFGRYTASHIADDQISLVDAVNGAFMLVRRRALDDVGLLDEDFWMYGEDLDWCFRFWQAGWPILYWPGVEVMHVKGGSSSKVRSWKTNKGFHEAMWLFHKKHYSARSGPWLTRAVWAGIHLKMLLSAARSTALRRLQPR